MYLGSRRAGEAAWSAAAAHRAQQVLAFARENGAASDDGRDAPTQPAMLAPMRAPALPLAPTTTPAPVATSRLATCASDVWISFLTAATCVWGANPRRAGATCKFCPALPL